MQRLLMGEVGSGKTVVALYAMLRVAEQGMQAALMAPTETLAEQHYATLERLIPVDLFAGAEATRLGPPIGLLTGSTPARERRDVLERLAAGELRLLVGTHALIQDSVSFERLALTVVDEQHRFGVRQRTALDEKGAGSMTPHLLHMTATPIPRTMSLTLYGDLHTTALRELPKGRRPVKTWVVPESKREGAYEFIRERLREGRQCFVVCPLVEESEQLQARAATREAERLAAEEFGDFRVGVMHGQMPARDKRAAMAAFASGELDLLVATSVIEVGVDVPNATVMVIEEADRYGLSQMHQLRGRVGRGRARVLLPAVLGLAQPARPAAAEGAGRGARRLPAGRDRPHAARRGRPARHQAVGPAGLPRRAAARGLRPARACAAALDRDRALGPRAGAARARAPARGARAALRRARGRADRGVRVVAGRVARAPAVGTRRRRDPADGRPRARGAVQHPRPGRGARGARPLRRLGGARHRGAVARRGQRDVRRLLSRGAEGSAREPRAARRRRVAGDGRALGLARFPAESRCPAASGGTWSSATLPIDSRTAWPRIWGARSRRSWPRKHGSCPRAPPDNRCGWICRFSPSAATATR